jgi:hypothetical protein
MPISFLELVPVRPHATVVIEGEAGPAQFEITGITLTALAEIARKYPAFAHVVEGNAGLMTATEAMPALIAAGLGHYGDPDYERHAGLLPSDLVISLAGEIVKLTFPARPSLLAEPEPAEPEPAQPTDGGLSANRPAVISQLRLSS